MVALLLREFQRLADAPDAVPRLRWFVLDLAVRGKLIGQKETDEPAHELLARIAAIKAGQLGSKGRRDQLTSSGLDEQSFDGIPANWAWSCVASVGFINPRNEAPDDQLASFVPMPFISAQYGVANGQDVRPWAEIKTGYTHFAEGDVGLAKITPCFENGKSTVFRNLKGGIGAGTTELHIVRPILVNPDYLLIFLKSPRFIATGIPMMTGTAGQRRVSTEYFARAPLPLPPLAEQNRIVAKVHELMALCNQLEAAQKEREFRRDALRSVSLRRLTSSEGEGATSGTDVRFFLGHSPRLITKPEHVAAIRQTIRDLAVRGQLVRQDPRDGPVEALIERIWSEKPSAQRHDRPKVPTGGAFEIPKTWRWVDFGDITLNRDGERVPVSKDERSRRAKKYDYYGASGVIDKIDDFLFDKPLLLIGEDGANLINRSTPIAFIARGQYWVNNHAHVVDGTTEEFLRYVELYINAIDLKPYLTGTAQPKMNQAKMNGIQVALPPEKEQHRIVAKVDELMTVCDYWESALATGQDRRRRLLEALLYKALEGAGVPEQAEARAG